ncbi:MAG: PocR ligand-binding domain-containing protein [Lentisphaeria bacterium]|nr:MAG: PocR ligand-binding domain-containing protein [Lentisphaeria bacterium]
MAFHDLTGEITALAEPEELPLHHLAPCCEEMRSRNRECYERCVQCDTRLIQPHLAAGRPFRKLCHAGFFEAVFPLMKFGAPAGVMFLGVFRPPEGALPEVFQPPEKVVFPPEQEPPEDLIWFGSLFADSIRRRLEEIPGDGPAAAAANRSAGGWSVASALRRRRRKTLPLSSVSPYRAPASCCVVNSVEPSLNCSTAIGSTARPASLNGRS